MNTLGADDNIAAISTSNQALCDLTAGRRHVVYSTGITAPNLPVMKTQLEREKKRRGIMIMECQTAEVGNKMRKIDFGPHRISSLAVWRSWRVRLKRRLSSECLCAVFMWACVQDPVSQCAHRDIKHYHRSISKRCGYGSSLFAGVCDRERTQSLPHVTTVRPKHWQLRGKRKLCVTCL